MAAMAQPVQVSNTWGIWDQMVRGVRLVIGYYLWNKQYRSLWRERPDVRQKILINIAFYWLFAWLLASGFIVQTWEFNFLLPFFSVFTALATFLALYLPHGRNRSALIMSGTVVIVLAFWLVMINVPVAVLRDVERLPWLLGNLMPLNDWGSYAIWGGLWIGLITLVMMWMPIWMIEIQYGEVFLVHDQSAEGFHLSSRAGPKVDREVINTLVAAGIPKDVINSFIHYNGPRYMRKVLVERAGPEIDMMTHRMLQTLFEQVADQKRTPPPVLWVSALDRERLLWDCKKSVPVALEIDQLVTKDGHPIKIALEFSCSFNPEAIRAPEFRLGLTNVPSVEAMQNRIETVMKAGAMSVARLYFIHLSLRDALTQGAVEEFRRDFPGLMAGFGAVGITVKPASVNCRPVLDRLIIEAETEMLASRARALAETAKLQALVEKVILHGVPADLLAGLMFVDQSTTGEYKSLQLQSDAGRMALLPEASNQQQARYLYQKFQGDIPREMVPQLPDQTVGALPSGEEAEDEWPTSYNHNQADWISRGSRFTSNLGDRKKPD